MGLQVTEGFISPPTAAVALPLSLAVRRLVWDKVGGKPLLGDVGVCAGGFM